jgi:hypothetical protein
MAIKVIYFFIIIYLFGNDEFHNKIEHMIDSETDSIKLIMKERECNELKQKLEQIEKENKELKEKVNKLENSLKEKEVSAHKINNEKNKLKLDYDNSALKKEGDNRNLINNLQIQNTYTDLDGNYLQFKKKYEPNYSLYTYREVNDDEDDFENYLLLRIEIPGNLTRLTARSTDPKMERYKGIVIKAKKEEDEIPEKEKDKFTKIYDNRVYDEISYFIELRGSLKLYKKLCITDTEIYKIKFDKRNKEKYFINKDNQKITVKENANDNKTVEGEKIASGVYILKFALTQDSF